MNFHLMSRSTAIENNLKHYFTGKPCSRGVVWLRRVNGGHCVCELCTLAKCEREGREAPQPRKRLTKAEQLQSKKDWYRKNKESEAERSRVRRIKKGDEIRAKQKEWRDANREHMQQYYQDNKANYLAHTAKRRAAQLNATPSWFRELDEFVIAEAYAVADMRSKATGLDWHVDHMVPLQAKNACGLHVWNNVQVIPWWVNLFKNNKLILVHPFEWVRFAFH